MTDLRYFEHVIATEKLAVLTACKTTKSVGCKNTCMLWKWSLLFWSICIRPHIVCY